MGAVLAALPVMVGAATYYGRVATGAWNVAATWSTIGPGAAAAATVPGSNDDVIIERFGITSPQITIPAGYTANAKNLRLGNSGQAGGVSVTMAAASSALTMFGDVTIFPPNNATTNALNVNAGTMTVPTKLTLESGTGTARVQITTGTLTVTVDLELKGAAAARNVIDMSGGAGTLNISDKMTITTATLTPGTTSTVNFNRAGDQTVPIGVSSVAYANLTLSGSGNKTPTAGTGSLAGSFTLSSGVTWVGNSNNPVLNIAGNFTNNGTAFTQGTGTVTMSGTAAQAIDGTTVTTFNNLTISNTSAAVSANTNFNVAAASTLTVNANAVLTPAAAVVINNAAAAGTVTGAGTVRVTRTAAIAGYSNQYRFTTNTLTNLTVEYIGAAAQTVSALTYGGLKINNSSGVTLAGNATVGSALTFAAGVITTGANTLTIGASGSTAGTPDATRHVVGNMAKAFSAATAFTYAVGDGTKYTPLAVTFSAAVTGNLTASVTNTDHPDTTGVTSGIDKDKSINRYWTLKNSTISGTYSAALTYFDGIPVDRDSGATAASFIIRRGASCSASGGGRNCTSWGLLTLSGVPSNTLATATGVSISSGALESDFVVGEAVSTRFSREKEFIFTRELY